MVQRATRHGTKHASREEAAIAAKIAVSGEATGRVEVAKCDAGAWKVTPTTDA
jgi:hypothetical protein